MQHHHQLINISSLDVQSGLGHLCCDVNEAQTWERSFSVYPRIAVTSAHPTLQSQIHTDQLPLPCESDV